MTITMNNVFDNADYSYIYENIAISELQDIFTDYHHDVYGYNPPKLFSDRDSLIYEMFQLDDTMTKLYASDIGKELLATNGWITGLEYNFDGD